MARMHEVVGRLWWHFRVRVVDRLLELVRDLLSLPEYVDPSKTYYPEAEQKSRGQMIRDHLSWVLKYGQIVRNYYLYGLDRKGSSVDEYIPYRVFRKLRDGQNRKGDEYTYVCTVRDKFVFGQLIGSLGYSTPRNFALLEPGRIKWLNSDREASMESILDREARGICKPVTGVQGAGIFTLNVSEGRLYIDGETASLEELTSRITQRYIFQERISQHETLSALHPASVNTLRLITARKGGGIQLFTSVLRVGVGGTYVDNWSEGSIMVKVNPETEETVPPAIFKAGPKCTVERHPDTGIDFDGYPIPHFQESVESVRRAHNDLGYFHTLGWDIVITPDGPCILECNESWGGRTAMTFKDNFKDKFLSLIPEK